MVSVPREDIKKILRSENILKRRDAQEGIKMIRLPFRPENYKDMEFISFQYLILLKTIILLNVCHINGKHLGEPLSAMITIVGNKHGEPGLNPSPECLHLV